MCFRRLLCARIEIDQLQCVNCLRNEFDFLKVHGIMNTSGLLQSKSWNHEYFGSLAK